MQNWKHVAHEAKDLLTVCLAKAIDTALTARMGADWFVTFAQADAKEKINLRITKPGQMSVQDMDLQALLKFLRFRTAHTQAVLAYHGFFNGLDAIAVDAQIHQLNQLLDRLMVDFRNRIEAHNRAADIEQEISGNGLRRIYGYEEAAQDMLRLARLFPAVRDAKGVPYCRRIEDLSKKKRRWWIPLVAILLVVAASAAGVLWWLNGGNEKTNVFYDDSNPLYEQGEITIQPIYVYYDGDSLVLEGYINNGTDETITELNVSQLVLLRDGSALAAANFGILNLTKDNLEIPPKESIVWRFTFHNDTVLVHGAALRDITAEATCEIVEEQKAPE